MIDGIKAALGRDEHVVAERDGRTVQKHAVVVDEEVVARVYVEAVVDADVLFDERIFAQRAEQFAQDAFALLRLGALGLVILVAQFHRADVRRPHFGVGVIVKFAVFQLLKFAFHLFLPQKSGAAIAALRIFLQNDLVFRHLHGNCFRAEGEHWVFLSSRKLLLAIQKQFREDFRELIPIPP